MNRAKLAMQQWHREKPELELLPMEVIGQLAEAAHLIGRGRLEPLFTRYGLQGGEFDVLATLRRSGAPFSLTPTELYNATMISSGGMTNRLDRLEKSGLVIRKPNPKDRRGTIVLLSKKGIELIDRLVPEHLANEHDILKVLSIDEQKMLNTLLTKLISGLN